MGAVLLTAMLFLLVYGQVHAQPRASSAVGLDFDVGFMQSLGGDTILSTIGLQIGTSAPTATYTVTNRVGAVVTSGVVTSTSPVTVTLSADLYQVVGIDFSERNKGIHISSSDNPIFVVVENFFGNVNHGTYLAYPPVEDGGASVSSYEYYIISNEDSSDNFLSQFLLVGSEDNTNISLVPTQDISIPLDTQSPTSPLTLVAAGISSPMFELNRLQTFLVSSFDDLTGTRILSNKPLSVISGHQCANIPDQVAGCEPLAFQAPPASTWGDQFLLAPFAGRNAAQRFRLITAEPASVTYTCGSTTVSVDDRMELTIDTQEYCSLVTSSPAMVVQLSVGTALDALGDPAIALVSPIDQYISETNFLTLSTDIFPTSYISVTVRAEHFTNTGIHLDDTPLDCVWESILLPDNAILGYGCSHTVSGGVYHKVSHEEGGLVSVLVYGFTAAPDLGYAYLAGLSLSEEPTVVSFLDLTQLPGVQELDNTIADSVSPRIDIPRGFIFGDKIVTSAYVSENGVISFDEPWRFPLPENFPTSYDPITQSFAVAPFWSDNDIRREGAVRYVSYSADDNLEPEVTELFEMLNERIQQSQSEEEDAFVGEWLLIVHWDQVHPSPHGEEDQLGIPDEFLDLVNNYQAIIISNVVTTFVIYSYDIEWSQMGMGRSAVVGFNARGNFFDNHPLSGTPSISCAVNGVSCSADPARRRKRSVNNPFSPQCLPTDPTLRAQALDCKTPYDLDKIFIPLIPQDIAMMLEPCPHTRQQAQEDCGRFRPQAGNAQCYETTQAIDVSSPVIGGITARQQCCYDGQNLITDRSLGFAGSMIIDYPAMTFPDSIFRSRCCDIPGFDVYCDLYFERRPINNGGGYQPIRLSYGSGDPHFRTFDGRRYDFQGQGDYTLLEIVPQAPGGSSPLLTVLGRMDQRSIFRQGTTAHTGLAMGDQQMAFHLGENGAFRVFQTRPTPNDITNSLSNQLLEFSDQIALRRNGDTLEMCHYVSGVKVTGQVRTFGGVPFIDVRVFIPQRHMGQTRALFGNFDGNANNEFSTRAGVSLGASPPASVIFTEYQSWAVSASDPNNFLLSTMMGRRKRQSDDFQPLFFEDLTITDEHRDICGDNTECLFDFAASDDAAVAMTTLEFGEESENLQTMLDNLPPIISLPSTLRVNVGPEVIEWDIAVVDPNEDSFTLSFQGGVVNAFVSELVPVSAGVYMYRLSITDRSQLDVLEPLIFTATDEDGASSFTGPTLEICGCMNGGGCTTDGVLTSDATLILNCNCPEAYGGDFCEEDRDGCEEFQCFDGTTCSDVPAPGAGAVCSSCPPGYTGDSQKCYDIDECAGDPTLCDQVCVNTDGGFMCACNDGYTFDEVTGLCQDIDECAGVNDCQQQCINDDGSFSCACDSRFTLNSDGRTCTVTPEFSCTLECENGQCLIVNIDPHVEECTCDLGYVYRRETNTCIDRDECSPNPCEQGCSNMIGSFSCECTSGYSLQEDARSCADIDECFEAALGLNDLCEADPNTQCVNTEGSFQCQCVPGYFRSDGACVRNSCPSLGDFGLGAISYSNPANADGSYSPGTVALYSCDDPLTLIGSNSRECGEDRQWSGMEPACELAMCEELDAPLNGAIEYTGDDTPPYAALTVAMYSCDTGYRLVGEDELRTCTGVDGSSSPVGVWTGSPPFCERTQCTALPMPDNSAIFYTMTANPDFPAGTIAIYMCSQGYSRTSGDLFRSCLPDGSWAGTQAVCSASVPEGGCPDIPDPENGNIVFAGDMTAPFAVRTMATYECDTGYYVEGESVRVCEDGDMDSWSGTAPLCAPIVCLPLSSPINGDVEYDTGSDGDGNFASSTVATFSCSAGFGLVGSTTSTCEGDGSGMLGAFSPATPTCELIVCPPLDQLVNGEITYNLPGPDGNLLFGAVATHTCNTGHLLVGSSIRTCTGDGSSTLGYFDEEEPFCQEITCPQLEVPEGGQISYSSNINGQFYDVGVMAIYSCDDGYSLENGDEERVCQYNDVDNIGVWSGSAPECVGTCPSLTVPADGSISYSMDPDENDEFLSGTIASFSCDEGFELFGEQTRMCQNNMIWTNSQPSCHVVCPGLDGIEFGSLSYSTDPSASGSFSVGTTASYECDINYSLNGMESRQCEADMEWSGVAPVCEPIMCPDLPDPVNGNIVFMSDKTAPFELGTVALYKCYYGFVLVGEYILRSCLADNDDRVGFWNATAPTCEPVTCPPLPLLGNDVIAIDYSAPVDAAGNYPYGTEALYSCRAGYYQVSGDEIRTCETSEGSTVGVWSGAEVVCEEIIARCPDIPNPQYGRVTFDQESLAPFVQGTKATYSCDLGYGLEGGDEVRTCEMIGFSPDGVWSGVASSCIAVITCPLLELPASGNVSYSVDTEAEGIGFGVTATYSCNHESLGVRGDRVRVCEPGSHGYEYDHDRELIGVWSGWNPSCELIQCPDIADPVNGQIVFTTDRRAPFDYGTTADYSCEDGYSLSGGEDDERVCGGDGLTDVGVWSGEDYICRPAETQEF